MFRDKKEGVRLTNQFINIFPQPEYGAMKDFNPFFGVLREFFRLDL